MTGFHNNRLFTNQGPSRGMHDLNIKKLIYRMRNV